MRGKSETHVQLRPERETSLHKCGLQGSPRTFANGSISVPDTSGEWLEHNPNLAECKWGTQHISGKLTYEWPLSLGK